MKNAIYFTGKALFILDIFIFCTFPFLIFPLLALAHFHGEADKF